jgi:hypothetical protein
MRACSISTNARAQKLVIGRELWSARDPRRKAGKEKRLERRL